MITRPAKAAGKLYPADADDLVTDIAQLLLSFPAGKKFPYGLVVPHESVSLCGRYSAAAFRHLSKQINYIDNVVIISAARPNVKGVVLPICDQFTTPLGSLSVNKRQVESMSLLPFVHRNDREHFETSKIEIQLPYLQTCLLEFEILPVLIGQMSEIDMDLFFNSLPSNRSTLIILSIDVTPKNMCINDPLEKVIFNNFRNFVKSMNRELTLAEADITSDYKTSGYKNLLPLYESYIVH